MSHVDDGELTAYADGAYPVDDPVALRISAHLSTCDNCRNRLVQNQDLRTRAAEILAFASPQTVAAPPFDTLTARNATSSPLRRRPAVPLAWAATIILALGLGWFGRGLQQMPEDAPMAAQDAAAPSVEQPAVSTRVLPETEIAAAESRVEEQQAVTLQAPAQPRAGQDDAAVGNIAGNVAADMAGAAREQAAPTTAAVPPPPAYAGEGVEGGRATGFAVRQSRTYSAAEAERQGIIFPRIPELPVKSVDLSSGAVVVEQILPDGKIIRVAETVVASAPPAAPAATTEASKSRRAKSEADASLSVAAQVQGKTYTVTGELPADSLRALGAKVRE